MAELRELREQNDAKGAEEFSTKHGIFSSDSPFHSKVTPGSLPRNVNAKNATLVSEGGPSSMEVSGAVRSIRHACSAGVVTSPSVPVALRCAANHAPATIAPMSSRTAPR